MATQATERRVSAGEERGNSSGSRGMNLDVKSERIDDLRSPYPAHQPQNGHPFPLHPSQYPLGPSAIQFQQHYASSHPYPLPRNYAGYDHIRLDDQHRHFLADTQPWLNATNTSRGAATYHGTQAYIPSDHHHPMTAYPAAYFPGQVYPGSRPLDPPEEFEVQAQKRRRPDDRRTGEVEVEAGLALAGMGRSFDVLQPNDEGHLETIPKIEPSDGRVDTPKRLNAKKGKVGDDTKAKKTNQDGKKSCAECRRLKAKCDRVFPCSNCRKRGCALVCPDGDLSCMQGKRLVLASTEQLHERISELEAALAQAHRQNSTSTSHPLLSTAHLDGGITIKTSQSPPIPSSRDHSPRKRSNQDINRLSPDQSSSASGSFVLQTPLQIPGRFGEGERRSRMAVESLLIDEDSVGTEGKKGDQWVGENAAPALIIGDAADTDSQDHIDRQATLERLRSILRCLPDRETIHRQATRFFAQSTWYQNILRLGEFETIYEPAVYAPTPLNPLTPHKLACVMMVLTLDTYLDVGGSPDNPLVAEYWDGVQQCFDTRFGWGSSIAGVQALGLVSLFVGFGWRGSGASNFYWLRKMTSAAQQLGLHKDPHPALPLAERTFRRRVFHEMYTLDCLMSINHGQRTAIPLENIETKYPEDGMALPRLKYIYMGHVKNEVIEIGCAPDRVPMEQLENRVQKVGKLLEQYSVKASPGPHCPILSGEPVPPPPSDPGIIDVPNLTRCTTSMCHFKSLLFLYRPSFRRLIARLRPTDPSQTSLAESERKCLDQTFLASSSIIAVSGFFASREPRLAARIWSTWVQTFSASVSLAALAIWGGPFLGEGFVRRAYDEMRGGCDMIRAHGCQRAQGVLALLPILCNLVENRYPRLVGQDRPVNPAIQQGEDMLFILLGGQVDQQPNTPQKPAMAATSTCPPHKSGLPPSGTGQAQVHWQSPALFANTGVSLGPSNPVPPQWLNTPDTFPTGQALPLSAGGTSGPYTGAAVSDPFYVQPDQQPLYDMDPAEVWARLQTFYEPAVAPPVWHGQGLGGQAVFDPFGVGAFGVQGSSVVDKNDA